MRLYDLKTLHMKKCVGIDQNPYFSWKIANDKNDTVQCAYQLQVLCDEECLWDTGKVESEKQSFVEYEGITLSSRTEYKWKVFRFSRCPDDGWRQRAGQCGVEGA